MLEGIYNHLFLLDSKWLRKNHAIYYWTVEEELEERLGNEHRTSWSLNLCTSFVSIIFLLHNRFVLSLFFFSDGLQFLRSQILGTNAWSIYDDLRFEIVTCWRRISWSCRWKTGQLYRLVVFFYALSRDALFRVSESSKLRVRLQW